VPSFASSRLRQAWPSGPATACPSPSHFRACCHPPVDLLPLSFSILISPCARLGHHWHFPELLVDLPPGRCLATSQSLPHLQHRDAAIPSGHYSGADYLTLLAELEAFKGSSLAFSIRALGIASLQDTALSPRDLCCPPYLMFWASI
jgi:hypothetical protein